MRKGLEPSGSKGLISTSGLGFGSREIKANFSKFNGVVLLVVGNFPVSNEAVMVSCSIS
jgi:hypothetical protein